MVIFYRPHYGNGGVEMKEIAYTVKSRIGINPRFASQLKNLSQRFSCNITVSKGSKECSGKDLYGLIMLETRINETITVKAVGQDEDAAIDAIRNFLEKKA
jgi:phosphocarrier protein